MKQQSQFVAVCPYCREEIDFRASRCKHCHASFTSASTRLFVWLFVLSLAGLSILVRLAASLLQYLTR